MSNPPVIPAPEIQQHIYFFRGKRVIMDAPLARYYGVETRDLNKAVARNLDRFPEDFSFTLTLSETKSLMFQLGTSKAGRGGVRKPARVFTEQGVAMLAGVLRSPRAVAMSIAIVRAFVQIRDLLAQHRELAVKLGELERKLQGTTTLSPTSLRQSANCSLPPNRAIIAKLAFIAEIGKFPPTHFPCAPCIPWATPLFAPTLAPLRLRA